MTRPIVSERQTVQITNGKCFNNRNFTLSHGHQFVTGSGGLTLVSENFCLYISFGTSATQDQAEPLIVSPPLRVWDDTHGLRQQARRQENAAWMIAVDTQLFMEPNHRVWIREPVLFDIGKHTRQMAFVHHAKQVDSRPNAGRLTLEY